MENQKFREFKFHLKDTEIPTCELERASRQKTVDLLVQNYPLEATEKTKEFLKKINRNDLAQKLSLINAGGNVITSPPRMFLSLEILQR